MQIRAILLTCAALAGCQSSPDFVPPESGFLSSYSNIEQVSGTRARYLNPSNRLGRYNKFIVEPLQVYFHEDAEGAELSPEDAAKLQAYMDKEIRRHLSDKYQIVRYPGYNVAEVRLALTDVARGHVSLEGEVLDSQSNVQVAAVIETARAKKLSLRRLQKWGEAKEVMHDLAKRFRAIVDEAHAAESGE